MGRVEVVVPIQLRALRERCWEILQIALNDHRQAWDLKPDGSYTQRQPRSPEDIGTHAQLMDLTRQRCGTVAG
jgi:polyphosphate kinase